MNMQDHVPSMHDRQPGERLPMDGLERLPEAGYFTPFLLKNLKYSSRMADGISGSVYEAIWTSFSVFVP